MTRRLALLLLGMLGALLLAVPAEAATSTVTLGQGGPSPSAVTIKAGDTVTFSNTDSVSHVLKATSKGFTLNKTLTPSQKTSVTFPSPGTFTYSDTYNDAILGISRSANGSVTVPAQPTPTSSPTAKPSASARPTTSSAPRPGPSTSASAVPTQSGVAVPPPIIGGQIPTAQPTTSVGPAPQVAPGGPSPSTAASQPATSVDYADPKGLTQGTSRLGLPTALAVVAVVGVATLLVRLLLAQPEADLR